MLQLLRPVSPGAGAPQQAATEMRSPHTAMRSTPFATTRESPCKATKARTAKNKINQSKIFLKEEEYKENSFTTWKKIKPKVFITPDKKGES